jgi:hypothetical protein
MQPDTRRTVSDELLPDMLETALREADESILPGWRKYVRMESSRLCAGL